MSLLDSDSSGRYAPRCLTHPRKSYVSNEGLHVPAHEDMGFCASQSRLSKDDMACRVQQQQQTRT